MGGQIPTFWWRRCPGLSNADIVLDPPADDAWPRPQGLSPEMRDTVRYLCHPLGSCGSRSGTYDVLIGWKSVVVIATAC